MNLYSEMNGQGIPLLLIHGVVSDHSFFDGAKEILQNQYQVIAYDRRGYGKYIESNPEDFSVEAQVDDACQVLKKYTENPCYVVTHSAGSVIALAMAEKYPELIKGMVLIDPSIGYKKEDKAILETWHKELVQCAEQKKMGKAFQTFFKMSGATKVKTPKNSLKVDMEPIKMLQKNMKNFLFGELNEIHSYIPDYQGINATQIPIVVGITSDGNVFSQVSKNDAEMAEWPIVAFPGGHNGVSDVPDESAIQLIEVLRGVKNDSY